MTVQQPNGALPWHRTPWQRVHQQIQAERLPHALLLCGVAGLGKAAFALALGRWLLCQNPNGVDPCQQCRPCVLAAAGNHPDLLISVVEEGKRQLGVQSIRDITAFLALKSQYGQGQVAVVNSAERMTRAAANALLKTLEEPSDNSYLLLVSDQPAALPATVRSRCQRIAFAVPPRDQALAWLAGQGALDPERSAALLTLAGGAPGRVQALAELGVDRLVADLIQALTALATGQENPIQVVERWQTEQEHLPELLAICLRAVLKLRVQPTAREPVDPDTLVLSQALPQGIEPELHRLLQVAQHRQSLAGFTLNAQIAAEELLIEWQRMTRGRQRCSLTL